MEDEELTELRQNLGQEIREARQLAGISQEDLALMADIDRSYVSQLERGIANPSLLILHRLAKVLKSELYVTIRNVG
ncbi:MAG: helix-turn-helix transcriptional regulator [Thiobacillus sp.]|jgi:transcriptional regulator with XRE-family HTH domain